MFVPLLVLRNAFRHKLRTTLTVVGIVVAITAFGLLRTIVDAWYAGANASSSARLVTRSSVSLVFSLPLNYAQKIRQVAGVASVVVGELVRRRLRHASATSSRSSRSGVDLSRHVSGIRPAARAERKAFLRDRVGAIAGRKLADKYGWKVGDQIPLRGTIYPGTWTFTLRGIYDGADARTDTSTFFFHFDYLNETDQAALPAPRRPGRRLHRLQLRDPGRGRRSFAGDRRDVQEFARRDADRDREGVPARLRRDVGGDPARDPGGVASS